jgi:hypothetical protein
MTCRTCGGLVIDHYDESKCINCGRPSGKPRLLSAQDVTMTSETKAATKQTCTWPSGCHSDPADDSVMCPHHRDMKKWSNENQKRKRQGLPPLPANGTPERKKRGRPAQDARPKNEKTIVRVEANVPTSAAPETPSGVHWAEWRRCLFAQMDQAIGQLEEQLTKTKTARAAVEAL